MSHTRPSYSHHAHHPGARRTRTAAAVSRCLHLAQGGYTLTHRGHQIRIGPVAFWIVVGTLVIMGVWSIATGTYFAFRENVLTRLIGHQAAMQTAYEDRIAALRAEIDRITSRQLLDQEQFEQKLDTLLKRQATLERRSATLGDDFITTGSIPRGRKASAADARRLKLKPKPINDTVIFTAPPEQEARLQSRELPTRATRVASLGTGGAGLDGILARVSQSLDKVAHHQTAMLTDLEQHYDNKARRMRSVLADLDVPIKRAPRRDEGGPFIPLKPPRAGAGSFARQLYRIDLARAHIDDYRHTLTTVPVRKPLGGHIEINSPFGVRIDPFNGRPAMHPGLDLRGEIGEPVHATAAGKVVKAGRDGGYGNLVEIDHGHGLQTRYGHLSEIDVKVGQYVRGGQIIGHVGSTGRSTGPHLHYETRIDGKAVDPERFLRAGIRLAGL